MSTMLDQENLVNIRQTTAAGKPLNQSLRNLQSRTPGVNSKTPFRIRHDENKLEQTGKAAQNTFVTPAPRSRAPLGAKTTNAKARAFQTPATFGKANDSFKTTQKPSISRRSVKENDQELQQKILQEGLVPAVEDESEPEFGFAPPPIVALPDPPLDFDDVGTYACLRPENFTRGVGEIYFQSPKDENGFSISAKREEEAFKRSLEDDLNKILHTPVGHLSDPNEEIQNMLRRGPRSQKVQLKVAKDQQTNINTLQLRTAVSKLSNLAGLPRARLPGVVDWETASSKQKRKSTFAVSRDMDTRIPPPSKSTIGFPKAKKPPSILPKAEYATNGNHKPANRELTDTQVESCLKQSQISPRKFLALYGEPPFESEMWFRLKELEILDRTREENVDESPQPTGNSLFASDEDLNADVDGKLAVMFEMEDADDFEL